MTFMRFFMNQISSLFHSKSLFTGMALLCASSVAPLHAQAPASQPASALSGASTSSLAGKQCILAGRLNSNGQWAPLFPGVTLLNEQGQPVSGSSKKTLAIVKTVRLTESALLSQCNGNQPLMSGDSGAAVKALTPAVKPDPAALKVEMIYYPPLRVAGQLVELQLAVPADRVIALVR
jgi:Flp pilus assembly protein TadD